MQLRALGRSLLAAALLLAVPVSGSLYDEECEACGLLVWRMQQIVGSKQMELESLKAAKEKRAEKSTKAHSKRWLRQEYAVELAQAVEDRVSDLAKDRQLIGGVCRPDMEGVLDSALRGGRWTPRCADRVSSVLSDLLGEKQDELIEAVVAGQGANAACPEVLNACTAARATKLLGPKYRDDIDGHALGHVAIGYRDVWTLHPDMATDEHPDGVYWFSKARMESTRQPPAGWVRKEGVDEDGEPLDGVHAWEYKPELVADHEAAKMAESAQKDEI